MHGRFKAHVTRINRIHRSAAKHTAATEKAIARWADRFIEAPRWAKWVAIAILPLTVAVVAIGLVLVIVRWAALFLAEAFSATRNEMGLRGGVSPKLRK